MKKVKVFRTALKKDLLYEGKFHGFFQVSYEGGEAITEAYPIALVEKSNGYVNEINADRIAFLLEGEEALSWLEPLRGFEKQAKALYAQKLGVEI